MNIPQHIAFIMDGNRRWARGHKLEILFGHDKGARQIEPLVRFASEQGIKYLSFWAFSTENWNRGNDEVDSLMQVFRDILKDPMIERMKKDDVRISVIGDISKFPKDIFESIKQLEEDTKNNKKIQIILALNYGGRDEIISAVEKMISSKDPGTFLSKEEIRKSFESGLYTSGIPDPDLLIRTGGEKRLSGYMPWQTVYTELYFTDILWPDFDEKEFQNALKEYEIRERRFGK